MICCYLIAAERPLLPSKTQRVLLNASFRVFLFGSVVVPSWECREQSLDFQISKRGWDCRKKGKRKKKEGDRPGPCSQDHTWRQALANNWYAAIWSTQFFQVRKNMHHSSEFYTNPTLHSHHVKILLKLGDLVFEVCSGKNS
jgi:hypothetical protein